MDDLRTTGRMLHRAVLTTAQSRSWSETGIVYPWVVVCCGIDWSTRGAFVVSGRLYTGHADGTMTVRDFDGATAGFTTPITLNGLTSTQFPISRITGMFFWNGRLYYTQSGGARLYFRRFTLGTDTGTLSTVAFSGGLPTGTATVVSGPAIDGQTGQSRGLFVLNLPT